MSLKEKNNNVFIIDIYNNYKIINKINNEIFNKLINKQINKKYNVFVNIK